MKIKEGFVIKKLGSGYVVVTVGEAVKEFNGMISLNPSGAHLWQSILDGADSRQKLLRAMLDRYEGLDEKTALTDLDAFLDRVAFALEDADR